LVPSLLLWIRSNSRMLQCREPCDMKTWLTDLDLTVRRIPAPEASLSRRLARSVHLCIWGLWLLCWICITTTDRTWSPWFENGCGMSIPGIGVSTAKSQGHESNSVEHRLVSYIMLRPSGLGVTTPGCESVIFRG
jgi:hypothetical protein